MAEQTLTAERSCADVLTAVRPRDRVAPTGGRGVASGHATRTTEHDIKPRSRDVTDGLEKAAARGMLRAVGMGDDDFAKPQIGVAS